jgi:hypothetical protein
VRLALAIIYGKVRAMNLARTLLVPIFLAGTGAALAQSANPACQRLEGQLTSIDRGNDDPGRAEVVRRAEEATARQQAEVDRQVAQSRKIGCDNSGFFSLFSSPPPQCGQFNAQVRQMRDNLERMQNQLEQLHGGNTQRAAQRRDVLVQLANNNCGPQYRTVALQQQGGFLEQLFGGRSGTFLPGGDQQVSGNFRTICVRTCDGYYFPISFSAPSNRFQDDERTCQRMCPAAQVSLYTYHNPGEDIQQAVSLDGRPYTELPTAFRYRTEFNKECSCRKAGQSWADAMKVGDDGTVEQGDIVVSEDRARKLSQPRDAQGRLIKPELRGGAPSNQPAASVPDAPEPPKGSIRTVGPNFYPVR